MTALLLCAVPILAGWYRIEARLWRTYQREAREQDRAGRAARAALTDDDRAWLAAMGWRP